MKMEPKFSSSKLQAASRLGITEIIFMYDMAWPDFEGRWGEVSTSPEIVLHLP
jgi:hypothetical protein